LIASSEIQVINILLMMH